MHLFCSTFYVFSNNLSSKLSVAIITTLPITTVSGVSSLTIILQRECCIYYLKAYRHIVGFKVLTSKSNHYLDLKDKNLTALCQFFVQKDLFSDLLRLELIRSDHGVSCQRVLFYGPVSLSNAMKTCEFMSDILLKKIIPITLLTK